MSARSKRAAANPRSGEITRYRALKSPHSRRTGSPSARTGKGANAGSMTTCGREPATVASAAEPNRLGANIVVGIAVGVDPLPVEKIERDEVDRADRPNHQ